MAIFVQNNAVVFKPHPKFNGVSIAKLAGKDQGASLGVSILLLEPGIEIPVHTHDESVDSIYCLEGQGEIFVSGLWQPLGPGDYCLVPAKEEHGVRNGKDGKLKLFIVHSPPLF